MELDRNALDRHITGGRYSKSQIRVTCPVCEVETVVVTETEYGASEWTPEECPNCNREFDGDESWEDDE